MRTYFVACSFFLIPLLALSQEKPIAYPLTKTVDVSDNYFGQTVADPYRWLESDSADTREWCKAQNEFAESYLKKNSSFYRSKLHLEKYFHIFNTHSDHMTSHFHYKYDGNLYYQKTKEAVSQLVIRPRKYGKTMDVSFIATSKNDKYVAVGLSEAGSDWDEVHVRNLEKDKTYPEVLKGLKFSSVAWKGDGFYYCRYPLPEEDQLLKAKNTDLKVYYHKLGEEQKADQLIYQERFSTSLIDVETTSDERFLIIYGNDVRNQRPYSKLSYIDFNEPAITAPRVFLLMPQANMNVVDNLGDSLVIISNYQAPAKRVLTCNPKKINKLTLVIPEYQEPLEQLTIMDNKFVCLYKQNANFVSVVYDLHGRVLHSINFPVGCNVQGFRGEKGDVVTTYRFNTFTFPSVTYRYDLKTFEARPNAETIIPYDHKKFVTTQEFYESKDGTKIPIYIVHKKNLKLTGGNPCLLYGYGGFGISMTPFYDPGLIYFLEQGGVFAAPCIRGGGEYGDKWHRDGSHLNKQNSFDDFIAAAEYMVKKNYTNSSKLAMMGGSNGGLLVGAVMTQRPDLFKVAIPRVGVFDMLRYQNFTIGHAWTSEYGLSSDSVQFANLMKYSPLHNVRKVNYPSTLLITGDHDDRVTPLHTYKFAAALQQANQGKNPVLMLINENAGHNGPRDYKHDLEEQARVYGFILSELGEE